MNWRTPIARCVYWTGGLLVRIKYPQHTYMIDWEKTEVDAGLDIGDVAWIKLERTWQSVRWAWDLLDWSEHIDPRHWEHWAVDHEDCWLEALEPGTCGPCGYCGGVTCNALGIEPPSAVTGDGS